MIPGYVVRGTHSGTVMMMSEMDKDEDGVENVDARLLDRGRARDSEDFVRDSEELARELEDFVRESEELVRKSEELDYAGDKLLYDPVFGEIKDGGPNFRNVGWVRAAVLMIKTQIGIGALSIPGAFDIFGIIPGVICLVVIGLITTWSDYMVGQFKLRHPEVYGLDDSGFIMFGRIGREVFGLAFCLYFIFVSSSAILGFSIGLNVLSDHAACTAIFVAAAAVLGFIFASIRTLSSISWLAAVGIASILVSIFTVMIATAVQDRPAAAPQTGPWQSDWQLVASPDFAQTMSGISTVIFAYSGTPAFFPIASEMKDPNDFTRAMLVCQATVFTVYLVIGVVVYYYCGSYVASPALGSAGALMKKVCYGLGMPGLLVTIMIVCHLPAKYFFVRILRGSRHLTSNTFIHWTTWLGCTFGVVLIAYIIASAVPNFGGLVSLIGAMFGTFICFQPMACMWLHDNWSKGRRHKSWQWIFMVGFSVFVIVSGTFCMVAGSYGAIVGIIQEYRVSGGSAWSCADNSNSSA